MNVEWVEPEGLVRDGHQGELGAQARDRLAGPQTPEVAVLPQRGDVDHEAGHPATVVAPGGVPGEPRLQPATRVSTLNPGPPGADMQVNAPVRPAHGREIE